MLTKAYDTVFFVVKNLMNEISSFFISPVSPPFTRFTCQPPCPLIWSCVTDHFHGGSGQLHHQNSGGHFFFSSLWPDPPLPPLVRDPRSTTHSNFSEPILKWLSITVITTDISYDDEFDSISYKCNTSQEIQWENLIESKPLEGTSNTKLAPLLGVRI